MATRQFDFTGSVVDTSSLPSPVEDATADGDIPNYGQVARRTSWFDRQSGIAGVRAIVAADRADGQIVFESGTPAFWEFVSGDTTVDDGATALQPDDDPTAPAGRWLNRSTGGGGGGASGNDIVYEIDQIVASVENSESLADRDAVSLVRYDGGNGYLYTKSLAGSGRLENSFLGFSKGAVTGTQQSSTLTLDAALVTGNVISLDVNGTNISRTFASSSDETLEALAADIAALDDIDPTTDSVQVGADKLGNDDRVINVFGGSGRNTTGYLDVTIDNISITGGASQSGLVFATSTAAVRNPVDCHRLGPLGSFTGLMEGPAYYLSSTTPGGISETATNRLVGYGLSTTALLVEPDTAPVPADLSKLWFVSHGASSQLNTSEEDDIEAFDFTSWSASYPASGTARFKSGHGELGFGGFAHALEGRTNTGLVNTLQRFNKSSWAAISARGTNLQGSGGTSYSGDLVVGGGSTDENYTNASDDLWSWNGSSWTKEGDLLSANRMDIGCFVEGGVWRRVNGNDTSALPVTEHQKWNGSTMSSDTVPTNSGAICGNSSPNGGIYARHTPSPDDSQEWSGTSWSSAVSFAQEHSSNQTHNIAPGNDGTTTTYVNGGNTGAGSLTVTDDYNGSSWSSGTSSTLGRRNHTGGVI